MFQKSTTSRQTKRVGVAMISSVFYPSIGGAQTHTLRLSQKLMQRGVDVLVVTRHYKGLARYENINGVPTYRVGMGDRNKAIAAITYILGALKVLYAQRHQYKILHCHLMISPMTIGLLARPFLRKPLIINPHRSGALGDIATVMQKRPLLGRLRLAAAQRWGNAFVSISGSIHNELRDIGVTEDQLWDIPNGVDIEQFRPVTIKERTSIRQSLGLPNVPLVLFAGRLVPEKGVDVLLASWPKVLQQEPEAVLVIVGDGEERATLEAQAHELGIASQVLFMGGQTIVAPYLQAADVFVLPSYAEGLPVALLEAMACGIACVATAISGTMQVLEDGVSGRLVPAGNAEALAVGVREALTTAQGQEWSRRARQHIVNHYSLDVIVDTYLHMYETLLQDSNNISNGKRTRHA